MIKIIAKIHKKQGFNVLACCDYKLLGKKIKFNGIEIELKKSFYGNKKIKEKKLIELIKESNSINLIGNKTIDTVIKNNLASKEQIIKLNGIKHLQIIKL